MEQKSPDAMSAHIGRLENLLKQLEERVQRGETIQAGEIYLAEYELLRGIHGRLSQNPNDHGCIRDIAEIHLPNLPKVIESDSHYRGDKNSRRLLYEACAILKDIVNS